MSEEVNSLFLCAKYSRFYREMMRKFERRAKLKRISEKKKYES